MQNFYEWVAGFEGVFPEKPNPLNNPESKETMIRVEKWNKHIKKLDGGDIIFFDNWEEAKEWMENDYFSSWFGSSRDETIKHNKEHGVYYKATEEFGNAEAHNEWGY